MSKAPREQLDSLHELLAHTLSSEIKQARDAEDKKGEFASLLNVARQFLKYNGVEVAKEDRVERFRPLTEVLPFAGPTAQ
jgi:hypothetical protein